MKGRQPSPPSLCFYNASRFSLVLRCGEHLMVMTTKERTRLISSPDALVNLLSRLIHTNQAALSTTAEFHNLMENLLFNYSIIKAQPAFSCHNELIWENQSVHILRLESLKHQHPGSSHCLCNTTRQCPPPTQSITPPS